MRPRWQNFKLALSLGIAFATGSPLALGDGGPEKGCESVFNDRIYEAPPSPSLDAALVAFRVSSPLTWQDFLGQTEGKILAAASEGAKLIVFPELTVLAVTAEGPALADLARTRAAEYFELHRRLARQLGVSILAGSFPRETAPGRIVNTAALVFPDGRTVFQDKLNLTPDEVAWGWKEGATLEFTDAPWGRTAVLICYDSQFPSLSEALVARRPDVILVPSMTGTHGHARVNLAAQARAVEHHAFVLATGVVGRDATDTEYVGQAAVYTPREEGFPGILAQSPVQTDITLHARLNLVQLRKSQAATGIFAARAERERDQNVSESTSRPRN